METKTRTVIIEIGIGVAVAAGLFFWLWSKNKQFSSSPATLGGQIFDKTQNQLQGQVPDANPFKDQKNPLDAIYQNPFE